MNQEMMMHQIKNQNQQYQKLVLLDRLQYLKLVRRVHDVLTKKNINNSFLTTIYYIIISKLL
jgi:hypothetical protein